MESGGISLSTENNWLLYDTVPRTEWIPFNILQKLFFAKIKKNVWVHWWKVKFKISERVCSSGLTDFLLNSLLGTLDLNDVIRFYIPGSLSKVYFMCTRLALLWIMDYKVFHIWIEIKISYGIRLFERIRNDEKSFGLEALVLNSVKDNLSVDNRVSTYSNNQIIGNQPKLINRQVDWALL